MAVFTLEELKKLPQDAIFLAVVDRMSEQSPESMIEFQEAMESLESKEQEYVKAFPSWKKELQSIFAKKREDLFLNFHVEATILYQMDSHSYVDLLYNEYLQDGDYVFEDSLFQILPLLDNQPLKFRESFQTFPYKKIARVDDSRFSYYHKELKEYVPGAFLIDYYINWEENHYSRASSPLEQIIDSEENDSMEMITVTRKIEGYLPYLSASQLEQIDFDRVYCAIIEYKKPYIAIRLEQEMITLKMQEAALKEASIEKEESRKQFLKYKKRRESKYETTNRATFDFKKKWWQEKEKKYASIKALETSYLRYCHCCASLIYETEDGFVDLYANQLLNEDEVTIFKKTMTPVLAYCNPNHIKIGMQQDLFNTYMVLTEPIVVLQDGKLRKTGPLLDAFGQFFYARENYEEKKKLTKRL